MPAALANHLLQSTIFAVGAGLVTLLLRNNHARTRYWIWLTASLKFLIPFSIFVELGHWFTRSSAPAMAYPQVAFVVDEISQPFTIASPVSVVSAPVTAPSMMLPAIWICGSAAVLIFWFVRWRRVAVMLRASSPQLEPGAFGIFRPVLYLPPGIADQLDEAQLQAIVAHERCHIRCRDNLTAALHMLVEAVFWFHPLVWWIGARLVDERERACDEEVVRLGSDPDVYAESILKVCQLYLASPLVCASGISGSDLAARIESIMKPSPLRKLSVAKKIALGAVGIVVLGAPVASGIFHASSNLLGLSIAVTRKGALVPPPPPPPPPPRRSVVIAQARPAPAPVPLQAPKFEVASVKPHDFPRGTFGFRDNGNIPIRISGTRVTLSIVTLQTLVREAYGVRDFQVTGAPGWKGNNGGDQFYDVEARTAGDVAPTVQQVRGMLQTLLAERFQLQLHRETKGEMPVYDLVVAKSGSKLKPSTADSAPPANPFTQSGPLWGIAFTNKSIPDFILFLNPNVDRPVIDKTGLTGTYDFTLEFEHNNPDATPVNSPDANRSIYSAVQEQLGLQLVPAKEPVETIVIDHAARPSEN